MNKKILPKLAGLAAGFVLGFLLIQPTFAANYTYSLIISYPDNLRNALKDKLNNNKLKIKDKAIAPYTLLLSWETDDDAVYVKKAFEISITTLVHQFNIDISQEYKYQKDVIISELTTASNEYIKTNVIPTLYKSLGLNIEATQDFHVTFATKKDIFKKIKFGFKKAIEQKIADLNKDATNKPPINYLVQEISLIQDGKIIETFKLKNAPEAHVDALPAPVKLPTETEPVPKPPETPPTPINAAAATPTKTVTDSIEILRKQITQIKEKITNLKAS